MAGLRFLQRWLKFLIWAHLETQDGLMDQPGIAIEPHSGVTAAPHPRCQRPLLRTDARVSFRGSCMLGLVSVCKL